MKSHIKKILLTTSCSIMSLGSFVPLTLTSTSCKSTNNPSHSDLHDPTSNVIPLNELQAQADTINTVDEAVEFMNQTLAKYYSFDMFQDDISHAYHFYLKYTFPNIGQVEYFDDVQTIEPNHDQRTINFKINHLQKIDCFQHIVTYQENWTGYRIPFAPILVNVDGVVKMGIACYIQSDEIVSQEPIGDSPKLSCVRIQDDPDYLFRGQGGIMPGTNTCGMSCYDNNFNQKLIYQKRDSFAPYPESYGIASNGDYFVEGFDAQQFPIQFSHLSAN